MDTSDSPEPSGGGIDALTRRLRGDSPAASDSASHRTDHETVLPGSHEWLKTHRDEIQVSRPPRRAVATTFRSYLYWLLLIALVPQLMYALAPRNENGEDDSVAARLMRTLKAHPDARERIRDLPDEANLEDIFDVLPGGRLDGAFLPRHTFVHWAFAAASAGAYFALLFLLFPGAAAWRKRLFYTAMLMGTLGIFLLLGFQQIARATQGVLVVRGGLFALIFYIVKFIGYSYRAALDPNSNIVLSFGGFTCGVGLCEELVKSAPLIVHYRCRASHSWKLALLVGLACGIGFGVGEGVIYCGDFYNGILGRDAYIVRFISCVALHAMWSGAAAIMLYRARDTLQTADHPAQVYAAILGALAIPIVLHGMYDTLLKKDLPIGALITSVVSFAYLAIVIEATRYTENDDPVGDMPATATVA